MKTNDLYPEYADFDTNYQCYIVPTGDEPDSFRVRVFTSRYYARKWINDNVPESGRGIWKVFEIDGYYRVFRYMEYEF